MSNDRGAILDFMRDLPTRKVNGIGRVFERELDAIGIKTCGDIFEYRASLRSLFGEKAFQFLIQCYLGLGRTQIQPAEEYERKSVGTESTFRDMSDSAELHQKLRSTAEELERDLARTHFKGRTLVLKIKLHTYEVFTRQVAPPHAVRTADDLYRFALPMLTKLERELPSMSLRLMGLRCTHLVSTQKPGLDFFGSRRFRREPNTRTFSANADDLPEWESWPEAEFEEAARLEKEAELNETERLSQEHAQDDPGVAKHGREIVPNPRRETTESDVPPSWDCPICGIPQIAEDRAFNAHIDHCLSRGVIREAVQETSVPTTTPKSLSEIDLRPKDQRLKDSGTKRKLQSGSLGSWATAKRPRP